MKRLLLTGATGFIGARTIPALRERGFEIHATRLDVPLAAESPSGIRWHKADLLEPYSAAKIIGAVRPSHLLHFAWYAEPGAFWNSPENFRWVQASLELFRAFAEGGGVRAVVAGTCAEYDWTNGVELFDERARRAPATAYGSCKMHLYELLAVHARLAGVSLAWGRIFHLYGPGEDRRRLIAGTIASLAEGSFASCTTGEQQRDFLHVQDVAEAFVSLLDSPVNGAVNIGSGRGVTVREAVQYIADALDARELLRLGAVPQQPGEPAKLVADVGRLTSEVGWRPRFSLELGLSETIEWWLDYLHGRIEVR